MYENKLNNTEDKSVFFFGDKKIYVFSCCKFKADNNYVTKKNIKK